MSSRPFWLILEVEDLRPTIETWMTVDPPCMVAVSDKVYVCPLVVRAYLNQNQISLVSSILLRYLTLKFETPMLFVRPISLTFVN